MRPEYRSKISDKYKSKIENLARKGKVQEIVSNKSECVFCRVNILNNKIYKKGISLRL